MASPRVSARVRPASARLATAATTVRAPILLACDIRAPRAPAGPGARYRTRPSLPASLRPIKLSSPGGPARRGASKREASSGLETGHDRRGAVEQDERADVAVAAQIEHG